MKCPVCRETDLLMTDRQGVEIDYCPQCRGVWLDRGELDKIIERTAAPSNREQPQEFRGRDDDWDDDDHYAKGSAYPKKKKRGSLLGELFDF